MPVTGTHRPGHGRDWSDTEIELLKGWVNASRTPPYVLLARGFGRSAQSIRLKVYRLRQAGELTPRRPPRARIRRLSKGAKP